MMRQLRWRGMTFEGGVQAGTAYTLAWVTGFSGAEVDRERVDRENAHGRFPAPGFLPGRPIAWGGLILGDSPAELDHAIRVLTGSSGVDGTDRLVAQGDRTLWVDVESVRIPDPTVLVPGSIASYEVRVEAPGAFLYGDRNTFGPGTSVPVHHYGNAAAVPVIEVTGTMPSGYTVTGPGGAQFIVSQALTSGQTHRLDFDNGWLYKNNVLQQGGVSRAETFVIKPGSPATLTLSPVSGSGQMTVKVPDTFS